MTDAKIDPAIVRAANHVLHEYGEGGYEAGSFTRHIIKAAMHADPTNFAAMRRAFPEIVQCVELANSTFGGIEMLRHLAAGSPSDWTTDPPAGWFVFGTHVDGGEPLEFWGRDEAGMPIWERPVPDDALLDPSEVRARIDALYVVIALAEEWIDNPENEAAGMVGLTSELRARIETLEARND